jgi:hypothetical protein
VCAALLLALSVTAAGSAAARADSRLLGRLLAALDVSPLAGQVPPAIALPDLTGARRPLGTFQEHALFLYFWASW